MSKLIATIGDGAVSIRVTKGEYEGKMRVDVRKYLTQGAVGDPTPTRKGISIVIGDVPAVIEALKEAIK